ncbi:hypothetical protein BC830DRAFT_1101774 [Chytriomyces sp. MP71]|nr:hypothetical protein BC830DRAFT_1101774 [Chytriomyces sp. MP71]
MDAGLLNDPSSILANSGLEEDLKLVDEDSYEYALDAYGLDDLSNEAGEEELLDEYFEGTGAEEVPPLEIVNTARTIEPVLSKSLIEEAVAATKLTSETASSETTIFVDEETIVTESVEDVLIESESEVPATTVTVTTTEVITSANNINQIQEVLDETVVSETFEDVLIDDLAPQPITRISERVEVVTISALESIEPSNTVSMVDKIDDPRKAIEIAFDSAGSDVIESVQAKQLAVNTIDSSPDFLNDYLQESGDVDVVEPQISLPGPVLDITSGGQTLPSETYTLLSVDVHKSMGITELDNFLDDYLDEKDEEVFTVVPAEEQPLESSKRVNPSTLTAVDVSEIIENLAINSSDLVELDLSDCKVITPAHGSAIADALYHNTVLRKLNLSNTKINTQSAICFGKAIQVNSTLEFLGLERNAIGPPGIKAIAVGMAENKGIKDLRLQNQTMSAGTDAEQVLAKAIGKNYQVTKLTISIRDVSSRGVVDRALARNNEVLRRARQSV